MDRFDLFNSRFGLDRFGPLGGEQKTSFDDESLSSTRRADNGIEDVATRPDEDIKRQDDENEVSPTKVTGTITTTPHTTTSATTTPKTITTTVMLPEGLDLHEQKLILTPPDVNHIPFKVPPQAQVWPKSSDSKKLQDYYEDEEYYYDDEFYKDTDMEEEDELDNRLKVTNIDEALKYFSREKLQYKTPPEENSLGPAVPLYSLTRNEGGLHQVQSDQNFDPGVLQHLPNSVVPVRIIQ